MISPNKEIRQLVRELERAGFEVSKKHNHIKIRNPIDGRQISIPSTPSGNGRQRQNMLMSLKQIGFQTEPVKSKLKSKQKRETNRVRTN
jgi:hypothetical protein